RSEFVMPTNGSGDGVCDTIRMFQIAEPASCRPALRPTRGSGDGATRSGADMSGDGIDARLADIELEEVPRAHAPSAARRGTTSIEVLPEEAMGYPGGGMGERVSQLPDEASASSICCMRSISVL